MEHLPTPADPLPVNAAVPLCTDPSTPYDGGTFLEYPRRRGKDWMVPAFGAPGEPHWEEGVGYRESRNRHPLSTAEEEHIYQSWFFFGVLHTILGEHYNARDYLHPSEDPKFITTAKLPARLWQMWQQHQNDRPEDLLPWARSHQHILRLIPNMLPSTTPEFQWTVKFSIVTVYELLATLMDLFIRIAHYGIHGPGGPAPIFGAIYRANDLFTDPEIRQRMENAGWCPYTIATLPDRFSRMTCLWYLSRMDVSAPRRDHSQCTQTKCNAFNTTSNCRPRHRPSRQQSPCSCDWVVVPNDEVLPMLENGGFPVLDFESSTGSLTATVQPKVVEYKSNTPYLALSHPWADGLGNSENNSLPSCQVEHLRELTSAIEKSIVSNSQHKPLLWVDTLCCPVRPQNAKRLALLQMRRVYSKAEYALVLDDGLVQVPCAKMDPIEILLRIFTSGWMQRLWTFQEALLPKKVLVQFADQAVDLDDFYRKLSPLRLFPSNVLLIEGLELQYKGLRDLVGRSEVPLINEMLSRVDRALQIRDVSKEIDESYCLAVNLSLPEQPLLNTPETVSERMKQLWRLTDIVYGGVPQGVLFMDFWRLQDKGFRWAPSKLMGGELGNTLGTGRLYFWLKSALAPVTEQGLLVRYPGFRITVRQRDDGLPPNPFWIWLPARHNSSTFVTGTGERFEVYFRENASIARVQGTGSVPAMSEAAQQAVALDILPLLAQKGCSLLRWSPSRDDGTTNPASGHYGAAILGHVNIEEDGVLGFQPGPRVEIARCSPLKALIWDKIEEAALGLRHHEWTPQFVELLEQRTALSTTGTVASTTNPEALKNKYQTATDGLKATAETAARNLLRDAEFRRAWDTVFDFEERSHLWRYIISSYYHDFVGEELGPQQEWCVG